MKKTIASLDAYASFSDNARVSTLSGAILTLLAMITVSLLIFAEINIYMETSIVDHLTVDMSKPTEKMPISFHISFPHIPCGLISVDAMDVSGELQLDLSHHIQKQSLDENGEPIGDENNHVLEDHVTHDDAPLQKMKDPNYCGSCYGAEEKPDSCCNTCDEVRLAYRNKGWALDSLKKIEQCVDSGETNEAFEQALKRKEGCRIRGFIEVQKVSGNLHFAPGKSFARAHMHVHDMVGFDTTKFNVSHHIHKLQFGESYPGAKNPLKNHKESLQHNGGMFMYYAKVVPTTFTYLNGKKLSTNQFSVTTHFRKKGLDLRQGLGLTGVFFFYELSPIRAEYQETHRSTLHFMTQICAILGGIFTVTGMLDKIIYHLLGRIVKQVSYGKLS